MKRIILSTAVLALAFAGTGVGSAAPAGEKVTGGGQILADGQTTGAGSTIAFNAQEGADGVKGQVQYVQRSGGTGKGGNARHGEVTCLDVTSMTEDGGTARLGGFFDNDVTQTFTIDVTDGGEGRDAMDTVVVREGSASDSDEDGDATCTDRDDFVDNVALGRGNVQVHKAK